MRTLSNLWNKIPDSLRRVLHTAWQTGLAAIIVALVNTHSTVDTKGLLIVGWSAAFAVLKGYAISLTQ
jgi:hypothetical protein